MAKLEELEQQYADAGGSRRLCNCCDQTPRDVWEFDNIPAVLRVQVSNIVDGALGTTDNSKSLYEFIAKEIAHEHGRANLAGSGYTGEEAVHLCLRHENNIVVWLDCVELSFRVIERILGNMTNTSGIWKGYQFRLPMLLRS